MRFSDYIIYVDESGDHSLQVIDEQYPLFVLSFCIFRKVEYANIVVPRIQEFKFRWFGHDLVILHENDIVKRKPPFSFLQYDNLRFRFMDELSSIVRDAPMTIVSAVIRKTALVERYATPRNPYELALLFCLERSRDFLDEQIKGTGATHVVCEARSERKKDGKVGREDHELELEFRRIVAGINSLQPDDGSGAMPNFDIVFASKRANSSGLQLADLVARPIGLSVLKPAQDNRAFEIIRNKIWKSGAAEEPAFGLKIFP